MLKKSFYLGKLRNTIKFFLISLITFTSLSFADTHIPGGNVNGIWTFVNSPYIIDGEINIPIDTTLTIEPGVQVIFSGHYKFNIYGRLLSIGAANDTITFTVDDTTGFSNPDTTSGGWHGLRFYDIDTNEQDSSKIVYCKLEYGKGTGIGDDPGGAIYCINSSSILIKNCAIQNNRTCGRGGGIFCEWYSNPTLINVTISRNYADNRGGGIFCDWYSSPSLVNVTISENNANHFSGAITCYNHSSPTITNCILWNNSPTEFYLIYGSSVTVTYSDIMGGWTGEGNINADPLFVDPDNGDFHLTEDSPCIDTGDPTLPPDPDGTITDMGAYYFHQSDIIPPIADFCADNTTGDAPLTVNFTDLSIPGNSAIVSWHWDFGDSTGSEEQNPTHTYDSIGIYTVSLRVIAENNGIDTETKIDYITAFGSGIHIPGGNVSGTWVINFSPYIIDGDIEIQSGDSLTIEPGIEVLFSGHYKFKIYGRLLAMGTETDSIIFTAQDTLSGWHSLRFYDTDTNGQDSSKIVYCKLEHGKATGNPPDRYGGAIYCENSSDILIKDALITKNSADYGGGLSCGNYSSPVLINVTIKGNTASYGGGIHCDNNSYPSLEGVTISGNRAYFGGGVYCNDNSCLSFSALNRCNIFLNYAGSGNDLYAYDCPIIDVIVDTFTVLQADNHFAFPIDNFTFDILNGKVEPVNQDLYVNPTGSNDNNGLTPNEPLKTISYALVKVAPDETNPHTIHLANGIYLSSQTGEIFPLNCRSYVSIQGEDEISTILDGEGLRGILFCRNDSSLSVEDMTIQNGSASLGSGIYCYESSLSVTNVTICRNRYSSDKDYISLEREDDFSPNTEDIIFLDSGFILFNESYNGNTSSYIDDDLNNGRTLTRGGGIFCAQSTLSLSNVTISENTASFGGGILSEYSNTSLENVIISRNTANSGGGIYIIGFNPSLVNVTINGNSAIYGGGMECNNSNPSLMNVSICQNSADYAGGGIYCVENSNLSLYNAIVSMNSAAYGGGILYDNSNPDLANVTIRENTAVNGGGFYSHESTPNLSNVTIIENTADFGGGIAFDNSTAIFDNENRCDIYLNYGGTVNDLYVYNCPTIDISVDTFTVLQPNEHFAYPFDNFNFDILNGKVEPVNQDLYVSPNGSNNNSGLTVGDPLKTISYALVKIVSDSLNPHIIHLSNGTYSSSQTGEIFPLNCRSYVSLQGEGEISTILDGEGVRGILYARDDSCFSIRNMTIQDGHTTFGGGIRCENSSPNLANITISNNTAIFHGGGLLCWGNSSPRLDSVNVIGNTTVMGGGGGIHCYDNSSPCLTDVIINNNTSEQNGGGIYCDDNSSARLTNVTISNNTTNADAGGISCGGNSNLILTNVTISNNIGSGFRCGNASPELVNVIITENTGYNGGGIEFCSNSIASLRNVVISKNTADHLSNGIYCYHSNIDLVNVTISRNISLNATAGGIFSSFSNINLVNCILWNEGNEIYVDNPDSNVSVTYSDIRGGWTGEGNIDADPLFANPGNGDFHLTTDSPCIDAGIPDTTGLNLPPFDLDGNPRIYNNIIDMGAYEWQGVGVDEPFNTSIVTALYQNFPNPFNKNFTTISFYLNNQHNKKVEIQIYNIKGQLVRTLIPMSNDQCPMTNVVWDGKDENDKPVSSGIYFYNLIIGNRIFDTKKCLLIR
ncbi:MAG: right-handed parallel beta-helix repeat-containing protein [Candidatus Cloacimonetes bacterium]|nr:right-handed parallel beta-helix repeat-containing protein [Candidatus Cloacimonadota bacterium]